MTASLGLANKKPTDITPRLSSTYLGKQEESNEVIIAELSCARSVCSGAPWLIKSGYLCIQEILVVTKSVHLYVHLFMLVDVDIMSHLQSVFQLILDIHVMVNWQLSK